MNLFLSAGDAMNLAVATFAEHLATTTGLAFERRAARTTAISLDGLDAGQRDQLLTRVTRAAEDLRFDFALLDKDCRWDSFSLLASDMDSTLITMECIDEIADFLGKKAEVAAITEAAMRGEITDFAESLRRRVALLEGTPASVLDQVYEERLRLSPGAEQLLLAARSHGLKTLLVSGGFTFFTTRLKDRLMLDEARSNQLGIIDGRLNGTIEGPILDAAGKRAALLECCDRLGVSPDRAIALGDGANDLPMMAAAGLSIAYHAKPAVRRDATAAISFGGLDVLDDWLSAPVAPEN
jgi:phosphoserine phosphatase